MTSIATTLTTKAVFSADGSKRFLLNKEWDSTKPMLTIIMLAPSDASGIELDSTTLLVLNNTARLGYGSVSIVNLFATLNDFSLSDAEDEDTENMEVILAEAKKCDTLVYAPGVGKAKNQAFQERSMQVLEQLKPYSKKLMCIGNSTGSVKLMHPLAPVVRTWHLHSISIEEALQISTNDTVKKTPKQKKNNKEKSSPASQK
ncbi:MAG: DUF1643 domain-containing protein [Clostridia bacterium]|nr:DUF1643 domain-containing protein [Clostridia bacterium]